MHTQHDPNETLQVSWVQHISRTPELNTLTLTSHTNTIHNNNIQITKEK